MLGKRRRFLAAGLSITLIAAYTLLVGAEAAVVRAAIMGGLSVFAVQVGRRQDGLNSLGLVYLPLGQLVAYLSWPFVVYTIRVVELLARLPSGVIVLGQISLLVVALFYALLLVWTFWGEKLSAWLAARVQIGTRPALPLISLAGMGLLAVLAWRASLYAPDGRLHLTVLDVGSGDALLVQTPNGRNLLVDGGPAASRLSDALGRRLPLLARRLDWVVVAAAGEEQLGALPRSLERFPVENVLWSGPALGTLAARQLQASLGKAGVPITTAQSGQRLDLGEGAGLRVLAVSRRGAVLLLEWRNFRALLPIGLDFDTLESLQKDTELNSVTTLLLADCGYAPVNPPEWVARLHPQVVLLSVGAGDPDGRPSPETLEAVKDYPLLRTDRNGWIEVVTDGERMWVQVEKK